jgi:hypothetical protein
LICYLIYAVSFPGDSYKTFSIKLIARELMPGDFHPLVETTKRNLIEFRQHNRSA